MRGLKINLIVVVLVGLVFSGSVYGKKSQSPVLVGSVPNWFPSVVHPSQVKTKFSTDLVAVVTFNQDATGCIIGNTFITVIRDNETNVVTVLVLIEEVDSCNFGQQMEFANGSFTIPLSDFTVDHKLRVETAKFNGTIFDSVSATDVPFGFQLTWTGEDDIIYDDNTNDLRQGSFHSHTVDNRTIRDASVTGSLTCEDDFCNSVFFFNGGGNSVMEHEEGFSNTHS